jgi:hypothetical protein
MSLKSRIQDHIDAAFEAARNKLLGEMDATVVSKLQDRGKELQRVVPEYRQRLLMVAHAELPDAQFDGAGSRFSRSTVRLTQPNGRRRTNEIGSFSRQ